MTETVIQKPRVDIIYSPTKENPLTGNQNYIYSKLVFRARFDKGIKSKRKFARLLGSDRQELSVILKKLETLGLVKLENSIWTAQEPPNNFYALRKNDKPKHWSDRFQYVRIEPDANLTRNENWVYSFVKAHIAKFPKVPLAQARIANKTGLSRATISKIITTLTQKNYISYKEIFYSGSKSLVRIYKLEQAKPLGIADLLQTTTPEDKIASIMRERYAPRLSKTHPVVQIAYADMIGKTIDIKVWEYICGVLLTKAMELKSLNWSDADICSIWRNYHNRWFKYGAYRLADFASDMAIIDSFVIEVEAYSARNRTLGTFTAKSSAGLTLTKINQHFEIK